MQIGVALAFSHTTAPGVRRGGGAVHRSSGISFAVGARARVVFSELCIALSVLGRRQGARQSARRARSVRRADVHRGAHTAFAPRHRDLPRAAAATGLHREDGGGPRLSVRRSRGFWCRHRLARRRVRCARYGFSRARAALCRVHPRDAGVVARRRLGVFGRDAAIEPCYFNPKPVQKPHPPIYFGGESDAALVRVATQGNGWYGFDLEPAGVHGTARRARSKARRGRAARARTSTYSYVRIAVASRAESLKGYRDAGVDQLIAPLYARDLDDLKRRAERILAVTNAA